MRHGVLVEEGEFKSFLLTIDALDAVSKISEYKVCAVKVEAWKKRA